MVKTNTFLPDFFKAFGLDTKDPNAGFFLFYGLLAGIAINDIWRILKLPGEGTPIVFGGAAQQWEVDYVYQLVIAGLVMLMSVFGLKYGFGFGSGMALGATLANQSETRQSISLLPFSLEPKQ